MQSFDGRAAFVFSHARERILEDCRVMHADNSAKGRLGSGSTATQAVDIFLKRMSKAVDQVLEEASKLIEHRGKAWNDAMAAISKSLEAELSRASELLQPSFKLARIDGTSAYKAVGDLIDKAASDLRAQVNEFKEGWTSPQPKRWPERHPITYAILLLFAGSMIGWIITLLTGNMP